ncbi:MAG: 50S ribosomal protein L11 methyltransferase [Magnetospirillum sp. WYHS-4]
MWLLRIPVTPADIDLCEAALEPHCLAVSRFIPDDGRPWRLEGVCDEEPDLALVAAGLRAMGVAAQPAAEPLADRDWVVESYRGFPAMEVGRFHLHGSHVEGGAPAGKVGLLVDAAAAFGSGEHATTRGCLLALDGLDGRRLGRGLDMGCGTAVLAMAAAKAFGLSMLAIDIDPVAVEVAADNVRRNGLAGRVATAVGGSYGNRAVRRGAPYGLILSNILANPLCGLAKGLAGSLAPGGVAILSGFLTRDALRVEEAHRRLGLRRIGRIVVEDWATLVLGRV